MISVASPCDLNRTRVNLRRAVVSLSMSPRWQLLPWDWIFLRTSCVADGIWERYAVRKDDQHRSLVPSPLLRRIVFVGDLRQRNGFLGSTVFSIHTHCNGTPGREKRKFGKTNREKTIVFA